MKYLYGALDCIAIGFGLLMLANAFFYRPEFVAVMWLIWLQLYINGMKSEK